MILKLLRHTRQFLAGIYYSGLANNQSKIAQQFRSRFFKTECVIDTGVIISNPGNFRAGERCALFHGTYILNTQGTFTLGNDSHLGAMCFVNVGNGKLTVGNNVAIGPHTSIIVYSNHFRSGTKITEEHIQEDINIGNNVFIGANCVILPGTTIEDDTVVGAGSVIKGRLAGSAVYAGVPCRKIRDGWEK